MVYFIIRNRNVVLGKEYCLNSKTENYNPSLEGRVCLLPNKRASVIKTILPAILIITTCFAKSQDTEQIAYNIISDVVRRDTVITPVKQRSIWARMKRGAISKADSVEYVGIIKNRGLRLKREKHNEAFRKRLKHDYITHQALSKRFSPEIIKNVMERLPESGSWQEGAPLDGFTLIGTLKRRSENKHHSFSDLVHVIDNQYLIYHERVGIDIDVALEYLLYEIKENGEYTLIKPIGLYYH